MLKLTKCSESDWVRTSSPKLPETSKSRLMRLPEETPEEDVDREEVPEEIELKKERENQEKEEKRRKEKRLRKRLPNNSLLLLLLLPRSLPTIRSRRRRLPSQRRCTTTHLSVSLFFARLPAAVA